MNVNKDKVIDDLLLLVANKNKQIKGIQETINYAIGGINALTPWWQDEHNAITLEVAKSIIIKDILAIKETLENGRSDEPPFTMLKLDP